MAAPFSASSRLRSDLMRLKRDPVPFISAEPNPANILEWHYVVEGPPSTVYDGGYYHGRLVFPAEYPFRPPSILMDTPSGRFKTNTRLCLSISDFHPDTWNPSWSVSTILTGLLSFMVDNTSTYGSIESSDAERRILATQSWLYNMKNSSFKNLFPEIVEKIVARQKLHSEALAAEKRLRSKPLRLPLDKLAAPSHCSSLLNHSLVLLCAGAFALFARSFVLGLYEEAEGQL